MKNIKTMMTVALISVFSYAGCSATERNTIHDTSTRKTLSEAKTAIEKTFQHQETANNKTYKTLADNLISEINKLLGPEQKSGVMSHATATTTGSHCSLYQENVKNNENDIKQLRQKTSGRDPEFTYKWTQVHGPSKSFLNPLDGAFWEHEEYMKGSHSEQEIQERCKADNALVKSVITEHKLSLFLKEYFPNFSWK